MAETAKGPPSWPIWVITTWCDFGISWVESRDGHELVKLEGAEAIQELQRVAQVLQSPQTPALASALSDSKGAVTGA
jgi:hypothetical protein